MEKTARLDKLFHASVRICPLLARHDVVDFVSMQAQLLAKFLIRDSTADSFSAGIHLVALPAGVFRAELWILELVIRDSSTFVEGGRLWQTIHIEIFLAEVGKEVISLTGPGRRALIILESHRLLGLFRRSARLAAESLQSLKEGVVGLTLVKSAIKQATARLLSSIIGRACSWGRAWNSAAFEGRFHRLLLLWRGQLRVVSGGNGTDFSADLRCASGPWALTLPRLRNFHSFLLPDHLNALEHLKFMTEWN